MAGSTFARPSRSSSIRRAVGPATPRARAYVRLAHRQYDRSHAATQRPHDRLGGILAHSAPRAAARPLSRERHATHVVRAWARIDGAVERVLHELHAAT